MVSLKVMSNIKYHTCNKHQMVQCTLYHYVSKYARVSSKFLSTKMWNCLKTSSFYLQSVCPHLFGMIINKNYKPLCNFGNDQHKFKCIKSNTFLYLEGAELLKMALLCFSAKQLPHFFIFFIHFR